MSRCARCRLDNEPGVDRCLLCGYPFIAAATTGQGATVDEAQPGARGGETTSCCGPCGRGEHEKCYEKVCCCRALPEAEMEVVEAAKALRPHLWHERPPANLARALDAALRKLDEGRK
jgi:hypothetical protein